MTGPASGDRFSTRHVPRRARGAAAVCIAATLAVLAFRALPARGVEGVDFDVAAEEGAVEEEAVEAAEEAAVMVQNFVVQENQIDQWVFRNQTVAQARRQADVSLALQIEHVGREVDLAPPQRMKLELAGRGDIHRFFDDFQTLKVTSPKGAMDQQQWQGVWQRIQPLQARFNAGLHGRGSLFERTIRSALNEEQYRKYESAENVRRRKHYQATVKLCIQTIESQIPLTSAQRRKLTDLVLAKTEPPRRLLANYGDFYYVMQAMAALPEADMKPIFLDKEWKVLRAMLQQYQGVVLQQFEAGE